MARNKGTFNFASTFEILNKAPLDARLVVDNLLDLTTPSNWIDDTSTAWIYDGMVVSVVNDASVLNNGIYYLIDASNYTNTNNWNKLSSSNDVDANGTSSISWQLNNSNSGVILKDVSGNLQVVGADASTLANIESGHLTTASLKIDNLNGILYAVDGSISATPGSAVLKAYNAYLYGNNVTTDFIIDHSLNTLKQIMTVYDNFDTVVYPSIERGVNSNIIYFNSPLAIGINYEIIILGY